MDIKKVGPKNFPKLQRLINRCGMTAPEDLPQHMLMAVLDVEGRREIVGTVTVTDNKSVGWLAVSPDFRRTGIGRALLQQSIKDGANKLRVNYSNWPAVRLYLRNDFLPFGWVRGRMLMVNKEYFTNWFKSRLSWLFKKAKKTNRKSKKKVAKSTIRGWLPWFIPVRILPRPLKLHKLMSVPVYNRYDSQLFDFIKRMDSKGSCNCSSCLSFEPDRENIASLYKVIINDPNWLIPTINTGELKGKWTTRFDKLYYKTFGKKLNPAATKKIGNFIQSKYRSTDAENLYMVIGNGKVDWTDGDFGDKGSCMFESVGCECNPYDGDDCECIGDRVFIHNRMFAENTDTHFWIKLYRDQKAYHKNPKRGIGRCWMFLHPSGALVLLNGYGELYTAVIAKSIAHLMNRESKDRSGVGMGDLYSNMDGQVIIKKGAKVLNEYYV